MQPSVLHMQALHLDHWCQTNSASVCTRCIYQQALSAQHKDCQLWPSEMRSLGDTMGVIAGGARHQPSTQASPSVASSRTLAPLPHLVQRC